MNKISLNQIILILMITLFFLIIIYVVILYNKKTTPSITTTAKPIIKNNNCISDTDCNNHGKCIDQKCVCDLNYKGEFCEIPTLTLETLQTYFQWLDGNNPGEINKVYSEMRKVFPELTSSVNKENLKMIIQNFQNYLKDNNQDSLNKITDILKCLGTMCGDTCCTENQRCCKNSDGTNTCTNIDNKSCETCGVSCNTGEICEKDATLNYKCQNLKDNKKCGTNKIICANGTSCVLNSDKTDYICAKNNSNENCGISNTSCLNDEICCTIFDSGDYGCIKIDNNNCNSCGTKCPTGQVCCKGTDGKYSCKNIGSCCSPACDTSSICCKDNLNNYRCPNVKETCKEGSLICAPGYVNYDLMCRIPNASSYFNKLLGIDLTSKDNPLNIKNALISYNLISSPMNYVFLIVVLLPGMRISNTNQIPIINGKLIYYNGENMDKPGIGIKITGSNGINNDILNQLNIIKDNNGEYYIFQINPDNYNTSGIFPTSTKKDLEINLQLESLKYPNLTTPQPDGGNYGIKLKYNFVQDVPVGTDPKVAAVMPMNFVKDTLTISNWDGTIPISQSLNYQTYKYNKTNFTPTTLVIGKFSNPTDRITIIS
jgi:hypothetical protein